MKPRSGSVAKSRSGMTRLDASASGAKPSVEMSSARSRQNAIVGLNLSAQSGSVNNSNSALAILKA